MFLHLDHSLFSLDRFTLFIDSGVEADLMFVLA